MFTMPVPIVMREVRPAMPATVVSASLLNTLSTMNTLSHPCASATTARSTAGRTPMPNPQNVTPRFIPSPLVPAEDGNRQEQMQRAAQLVETPHVPPHEGLSLLVAQIDIDENAARVLREAGPVRGVLLQPVQDDVDVVPAHATLHSSAVKSMRPISPKKR